MRHLLRLLFAAGVGIGPALWVDPCAQAEVSVPELHPTPRPCGICTNEGNLPVRYLAEAQIDSLGRAFCRHNLDLWGRTDSLYRAGVFGPPGSSKTANAARAHLQLRAWNGMDVIIRMGSERGVVHRTDEAGLLRPFGEMYASAGVYPFKFLRQGQVGEGSFCMEYDIPQAFDELTWMGGVKIRVHSDRLEGESGAFKPALTVEMPSSLHKTVDLVFEARFCGRVTYDRVIDRGDTLDLLTLSDIEGMHVRKFGFHKLNAIIFWRSHVEGDRDPARPRVGACAYFQNIHLSLPAFLPDLGLKDLRDFDVPEPILPVDWFPRQNRRSYDWIRVYPESAVVAPYSEVGPIPEIVEVRFPDL